MASRWFFGGLVWGLSLLVLVPPAAVAQEPDKEPEKSCKVLAWNDLGMHCMDADYSVFTTLPPYNTVHAQIIDDRGRLRESGQVGVVYEAMTDPAGSINTTSAGKTNFWEYVEPLFGIALPVDVGLPIPGPDSFAMPGLANTPQAMTFESNLRWFSAYGVPITPIDDSGLRNPYPLMRFTATLNDTPVASSPVVLPVSTEMDCRACHGSGSEPAAMPEAGWVNEPDLERDYRLNVLLLHDERSMDDSTYQQALATAGYNSGGLYPTVVADGVPILCANCHLSEALPGSGLGGIAPLTEVIHSLHAAVIDPTNGLPLDTVANRTACYRCHPGSETRCLRGAMGSALAPDGTLLMPCQSCHGLMSRVGAPDRTGWLDEPTCQNCHTGTAVENSGQIRYTSVFDASGQPRQAADMTFATERNVPLPGYSLYRYSRGHGGVYCEGCHGSTHAIFPTIEQNDNRYSIELQGHDGTVIECLACHASLPESASGGPHGLHMVGQWWVEEHGSAADNGGAADCQACHGPDYRGTVLSRAHADRTFDAGDFGTTTFARGFEIGCYDCHNGPSGKDDEGDDDS